MKLIASLGVADRRAALAKSNSCASELSRTKLTGPSRRAALVAVAAVPDDYDGWRRVVGLYPVATLPLSIAVNRWQDDTVATFRRAAAGHPIAEKNIRYEPRGPRAGDREISTIFAQLGRTASEFHNCAPTSVSDYSRPLLRHSRSRRRATTIALDPRGLPLVYDTIHPCGCYHMFFPTARVKANPAPRPGIEWAFVLTTLPAVDPSWRIVLQVTSRSHYLIKLGFDTGGHGTDHRFAEDDDLRALPIIDSTTRSAFGPDGIVPGTERGERLLFWPTGVEDTGAMRRWGRRATAFLGRCHFDDPDLIERRFSIVDK